jgi:proline dehydrogenase
MALVRRMVTSRRVYRGFVRRFVAGEDLEQALPVLRDLHAKGMRASADFLGESVTDAGLARKVVDEYRRIIEEGIPQLTGVSSISMKPSQLGMDVDPDLCRRNIRELLDLAGQHGVDLVRIDMEDHTYVDRTLELYEELRRDGYDRVGVVLQAYLYRTPEDLERLEPLAAEVRLCKGAYSEPSEVAHPAKADVDAAYLTLARRALESRIRPAFATHDPKMIEGVKKVAEELGLKPAEVEFQMLLGIGREHQTRLAEEGYAVRIYVPYGQEWYAYFSRRLAERPANMWFILKHLLHD